MEESLRLIASSLQWIAFMLTCHVLFKDCSGRFAIYKLKDAIMHEGIGDQLARIAGKLDKLMEKLDQIK